MFPQVIFLKRGFGLVVLLSFTQVEMETTVSLVKVFVCSLRKKTKPDFFLWPNLLLFFATNLLQEKLEFTECRGALKVFSGVPLINGSGWFSAS